MRRGWRSVASAERTFEQARPKSARRYEVSVTPDEDVQLQECVCVDSSDARNKRSRENSIVGAKVAR